MTSHKHYYGKKLASQGKKILSYVGHNFAIHASVVLALLFFLLSPGVLFTIPPGTDDTKFPNGNGCNLIELPWNRTGTCKVDWLAITLHSVVFGVLTYIILTSLFKKK